MPTYYFSGLDRQQHFRLLAREGAMGMVNALTVGRPALLKSMAAYPHVPLVLDSGAYQGNRDVVGYARLIEWLDQRFPERFHWFANLDVLGDMRASDEHYRKLLSLLPQHLHPRLLWVFHLPPGRQNARERQRCLERLASGAMEHVDFALGGIAGLLRRDPSHVLPLLQEVGEVLTNAPPIRVHVFGVAAPEVLLWLRVQPWFWSADSSRWQMVFRAGEVLRLSGEQSTLASLGLSFTAEECAANNIRTILSWLGGATPRELVFPATRRAPAWSPAEQVRQREVARFLTRHRGRAARFEYLGDPLASPQQGFYIPLFTWQRRQYGLINWPHFGDLDLNPNQEWCLVWEPRVEGGEKAVLLVDGTPAAGLLSHDGSFCHFPFHLATEVARALTEN